MSNPISVDQLKYTFRKERSQIVGRSTVTLNTVESQEIMATYFTPAARYISEIFRNSLSVRSIEVYESEREQFENITGDRVPMSIVRQWASESVMNSVKALHDEVSKKESQLMELDTGLKESYSKPVTVKLVLNTPEVNIFVSLIEAIDKYIEKIDQLWMRGELTVDEAVAHKKPMKASVAAIVQRLEDLAKRVRGERSRLAKKERAREEKKRLRREARAKSKPEPKPAKASAKDKPKPSAAKKAATVTEKPVSKAKVEPKPSVEDVDQIMDEALVDEDAPKKKVASA